MKTEQRILLSTIGSKENSEKDQTIHSGRQVKRKLEHVLFSSLLQTLPHLFAHLLQRSVDLLTFSQAVVQLLYVEWTRLCVAIRYGPGKRRIRHQEVGRTGNKNGLVLEACRHRFFGRGGDVRRARGIFVKPQSCHSLLYVIRLGSRSRGSIMRQGLTSLCRWLLIP